MWRLRNFVRSRWRSSDSRRRWPLAFQPWTFCMCVRLRVCLCNTCKKGTHFVHVRWNRTKRIHGYVWWCRMYNYIWIMLSIMHTYYTRQCEIVCICQCQRQCVTSCVINSAQTPVLLNVHMHTHTKIIQSYINYAKTTKQEQTTKHRFILTDSNTHTSPEMSYSLWPVSPQPPPSSCFNFDILLFGWCRKIVFCLLEIFFIFVSFFFNLYTCGKIVWQEEKLEKK